MVDARGVDPKGGGQDARRNPMDGRERRYIGMYLCRVAGDPLNSVFVKVHADVAAGHPHAAPPGAARRRRASCFPPDIPSSMADNAGNDADRYRPPPRRSGL